MRRHVFPLMQGEGELPELALSLNLRRRHLDESQRAMVAARLAKLIADQRKDLGADLLQGKLRRSRDEAAEMVNVSPRLVIYATRVTKEGCAELIAAVESGELALTPAAVLAGLSKDEQSQAVAGGAAYFFAAGASCLVNLMVITFFSPEPSFIYEVIV